MYSEYSHLSLIQCAGKSIFLLGKATLVVSIIHGPKVVNFVAIIVISAFNFISGGILTKL